jgi:RNA polymerase sigma-70 factor (ECF subfamily)
MNVKNFSDGELLDSLKNGEEAALTEIYKRYWKKMTAIAYNHIQDKSDSEEVVQGVLIKLWDKRNQIQIQSLPDYLATAVKYSVFSELKKKKRQKEVTANAMEVLPEIDHSDESIYARFMQDYINGLVDKLPEKCRLVFKYSREEGKKNSQIAEELDIAEKTVEAHLTKAIKSLRVSLRLMGLLLVIAVYVFSVG